MKIPPKCTNGQRTNFTDDFFAQARRLSVEYGVFVDVRGEYKDHVQDMAFLERIFFRVKIDNVFCEFEGTAPLIAALKKAIENKEQI